MKISKKKVALGVVTSGLLLYSIVGTVTVPQYETITLSTLDIKKEIDFTSSWYPVGYSKISLGAAQDIASISVKEGQKVSKNQVVAQLVDTQEYNQYKTAWSSYNAAIYNKRSVEDNPLATDNAVKAAQQQVNSAYYQMKNAENALNKRKLKTPIAGTVIAVIKSDLSSAGASMSSSSLLGASSTVTEGGNYIVVADTANPTFSADVSERDIVGIEKDMKVGITSRVNDRVLTGKVTYVARVPMATAEEPRYTIQITLDEYPAFLPYGAKVEGRIVISERKDTDALQYDAVTIDSLTKGSVLILKENEEVSTQEVGIGLIGDDAIEITSGVTESDVVVLDQKADKKVLSIRPWLRKLFGEK